MTDEQTTHSEHKMSEHTILLVQPSNKLETRTYSDFETMSECMEGNNNNN